MTQPNILANILVVEDEGIVALELRNRLQSMGYAVAGVAATGATAIEKATQLRPQLIVLPARLLERHSAVARGDGFVARLLQVIDQQVQHVILIIHDQDKFCHGHIL